MPNTKYEVVVVLDPSLNEEQAKTAAEKIEELITKNGGSVESKEFWGKRRLAYLINRRREGNYVLITFTTATNNQVLPELNRHLRISEEILRSLVTVAVVGKSKGTPLSPEEMARFQYRPSPRRPYNREGGGDRGGYDRGGDRGGDRPVEREAAPAPVADAAQS